jgi:3-phytase
MMLLVLPRLIASTLLACNAAEPPRLEAPGTLRVATFNASLNRPEAGRLVRDLSSSDDRQAQAVAEVIRRVRPDILLLNEFDFDPEGRAADLFRANYLEVPREGIDPIRYEYAYAPEVNTGVPGGVDLDGDGRAVVEPGSRGYGNDALGYGEFPGQYGMVVYSRFPIESEAVRAFRQVLWKDMPGAMLPSREDGSPWYSAEALDVLRLSSKTHVDVPIRVGSSTLHLLASHPTPPAFDGPERRNVLRNHDEIRLWADYLSGGPSASYLDAGGPAPEPPDRFVILGDLNADPVDGSSLPAAINRLLDHPRVDSSFVPTSPGASEAARLQGGVNAEHRGDPGQDTADFGDGRVGNLRVDYVLPSRGLTVTGGGVFWPTASEPTHRLVAMDPTASSDHRLVFIDIEWP